jgi:iron(III) transport system substrate-binding protein
MTRFSTRLAFVTPLICAGLAACSAPTSNDTASESLDETPARSVNVFTARHYASDEHIYAQFTEATGIDINLVEASGDLLIERVRADGERSPADVLVTVDAGRLWRAEQAGLFQAAPELETALSELPENLVHPDNAWFGFSARVRGIAYAVDRVDPALISDFTALATPAFEGRICVRSSSNVYNQSLVAGLIEVAGSDAAEAWAQGIVDNMARAPQGGDTDQIRAIAAGECDVAIVNHYYAMRLERSETEADQAVAEAVEFLIPSLAGGGANVNISGAGLAAGAPNRDEAIEFLQFMLNEESQRAFPELTNEYPIVTGTPYENPVLDALGGYEASALNVNVLGENASEAQRILDRVGWQ